jgi:hypothetical protein
MIAATALSAISRLADGHKGATDAVKTDRGYGFRVMPDNPTRPVDLSWFYTLDPKERVDVLTRAQSPQLANQLKSTLHERSPLDDGDVVARLDEIRCELNFWWQEDRLTDHLRADLIEHRADDTYRDLMQFEAAAIGVESPMVRTYLELRTDGPDAPTPGG